MTAPIRAVGLDFGTTNSAIAIIGADGAVRLARFAADVADAPATETFRSILFFESTEETGGTEAVLSVGNDAIRRYLAAGGNGRLIQSLKSFLADRTFQSTDIMGENYSLGDLIAPILIKLRQSAQAQFGPLPARIIVGRPVHFSDAQTAADDDAARARLDVAVRRAGWDEVMFEYEPVAAAYDYASRITRDETVMIADFGGGTSDFSILRLKAPRTGSAEPRERFEILGNDGVAIAGDAFDGRMIHHIVAPALGRGSKYRSPYGATLPAPTWPYARLERWHHLSMLKTRATLFRLRELERESLEPAKIAALINVIDSDLGYYIFREIERTKLALSDNESAEFDFIDRATEIRRGIARGELDEWIARLLAEIAGCVDRLMRTVAIDRREIDSVFLTGGSSFVPAVRRLFEERFGGQKIRMGNEFTSVARGLALRALEA
ncbi:MAG: Hsp70 family protein [Candidatus Binataceae bacterium]